MEQDPETVIQGIRLAMSADGYVGSGASKCDRVLGLSCAHPSLVKEWNKVFTKMGLGMNAHKKKSTWSGMGGLRTKKKAVLQKFLDYGGFIDGVRISGKSTRFEGYEKNEVLRNVVT